MTEHGHHCTKCGALWAYCNMPGLTLELCELSKHVTCGEHDD